MIRILGHKKVLFTGQATAVASVTITLISVVFSFLQSNGLAYFCLSSYDLPRYVTANSSAIISRVKIANHRAQSSHNSLSPYSN